METAHQPETPPAKLPLDAWHRQHGARMVPFAGYDMPLHYAGPDGGIVAEHEWTRKHASLFDVSHMGQISIAGESAAQELEKLMPAALAGLPQGRMRYSMLLTDAGGIIDDLIVTRAGKQFSLVVNGACKHGDIAHLRAHLAHPAMMTHHDDMALLALQGPDAAAVLEALVPGTGALFFMSAAGFSWRGTKLWVSRAGYTGEDGFEISLPENRATDLADALVADARVHPAGLGARDSLRLEAGLPLYGHDLSTQTDPVSAGLAFAIDRTRREAGGFPGHAAILARLAAGDLGPRRVGLALEGRLPAREGAPVLAGDDRVGTVTSGGFSPTLGHPVAMAFVDGSHTAPGTMLELEVRGRRLPAKVVPLPFVPHRYHRKGA